MIADGFAPQTVQEARLGSGQCELVVALCFRHQGRRRPLLSSPHARFLCSAQRASPCGRFVTGSRSWGPRGIRSFHISSIRCATTFCQVLPRIKQSSCGLELGAPVYIAHFWQVWFSSAAWWTKQELCFVLEICLQSKLPCNKRSDAWARHILKESGLQAKCTFGLWVPLGSHLAKELAKTQHFSALCLFFIGQTGMPSHRAHVLRNPKDCSVCNKDNGGSATLCTFLVSASQEGV